MHDAVDRLVQVGVVVDDDGVLAAHLGDHALDVVLARRGLGGLPVDRQADVARAGERDQGDVRVLDQGRADLLADAGQEVERRPAGRPASRKISISCVGDHRRLLGRLHDDGVAGDQGGGGHAGEDRQREVPGGDDDGDAARSLDGVGLAGHVAVPGLGQAEHLAGVVLAEVDRLGDVGVGLAPGLAALDRPPRRPARTAVAA